MADMRKIKKAAFRCRIQQWMDENAAEIPKEAYDELKEIMEDGE